MSGTTLLEDLRQRLLDAGVTPVATGRAPDQPDTLVILQTYAGGESSLLDADGIPADERHAVQVMARARSQRAAEALAKRASDAIAGRHFTSNNNRYCWAFANHQPFFVGVDANDRALVSTNITVRRHGYQEGTLA